MGIISVSLPSDGSTADVADVNTPITTIVNEINGNLDASNLASGAVGTSQLASGIQVATKAQNPYKFRVYQTTAANLGASPGKVAYDTKDYDTGTNFDVVTNRRFTAPVAGFYHFDARCGFITTAASNGFISLYKNGTEVSKGSSNYTPNTWDAISVISDTLQLSAGDYIEVWLTATVGNTIRTGITLNNFSGFMVSAT